MRELQGRIGARYPIVELATAVLSAAVAWKFGWLWRRSRRWSSRGSSWPGRDRHRHASSLPDVITLPLLWLGLLLSLAAVRGASAAARGSAIGGDRRCRRLPEPVDRYHLFKLITGKEGMGYGDFKLLAALGAWLGWQMLLPIIIGAAGVGALVGIASIVLRRRGKGVPMAFGPYLAAAGWIMLMWGPRAGRSLRGLDR